MQETIEYILSFLLGTSQMDAHLGGVEPSSHHRIAASPYQQYIGYTANSKEWEQYKVVIVPSNFWQDHAQNKVQMPSLPLKQWEGMPILFGEPIAQQIGNTYVIYADLVASAVFLLSRYEETLNPERDVHGRFQAVSSLAYKAGFLHRPLVDEYGAYLRTCLQNMGVELPPVTHQFAVTLTHDVDVPFEHRTLKSVVGGLLRGEGVTTVVKNYVSSLPKNRVYSFPWLVEQDNLLPDAQKIYFLRFPLVACQYDKPYLSYRQCDMRQLLRLLKNSKVQLGLHGSYQAGFQNHLIGQEKKQLEKVLNCPITHHRYHFLRTCISDNFVSLQNVGIKHDYTLGYADYVGFRLGTCRPVCFISPTTLQVGTLVLHSLVTMDVTLSDYMRLSYQEALDTVKQLTAQVKEHNGELVLLWHNTSVANHSYHKQLYKNIINHLNS